MAITKKSFLHYLTLCFGGASFLQPLQSSFFLTGVTDDAEADLILVTSFVSNAVPQEPTVESFLLLLEVLLVAVAELTPASCSHSFLAEPCAVEDASFEIDNFRFRPPPDDAVGVVLLLPAVDETFGLRPLRPWLPPLLERPRGRPRELGVVPLLPP